MACRNAYKTKNMATSVEKQAQPMKAVEPTLEKKRDRLYFGVNSKTRADVLLQNNIDQFEWTVRNKIYPCFYGRTLVGENGLTREEIAFLHGKGCKIAAIYPSADQKVTEKHGTDLADKMITRAMELGIPAKTALFLEIDKDEIVSKNFMKALAKKLLTEGYTPGFKANTDARFGFDREYSRGMQTDKDIFEKCLIWAVEPILSEYDRMTTTHLIHPDHWMPFAPSAISRNDIAVWQYGKDCHPIFDNKDQQTVFDLNLVKNEKIIIENMF